MAGDTFNTYYGEFLMSPIPIELSFNYCSHGCQYCFANLNQPDRKAAIASTLNLIKDCYKRKSFEAFLLREKYPVLISNRVDPFAVSNYRQVLPVLELLTQVDIPIAFQTKGGRGIDEALSFLNPSCWYISIAMLSDELRKGLEPGAPSIQERLDLIEKLTKAGHSVSVGINPCVPEWLPEPEKLIKEIASRGAYGVWVEPLHLNSRQLKRIAEKDQLVMGSEVVAKAKKRLCPPDWREFIEHVKDLAVADNLEPYSTDQSRRSDFFEPYKQKYPKLFPTHQEFINHLVDSGTPDNSLITLQQYLEFFVPKLPEGKLRIGHYVGATAHNVCREFEKWDNNMSYEVLLMLLWNEGRIKLSPQSNDAFSRACDRNSDGKLIERFDKYGDVILVFSQKGFSEYRVEVEV